MRTGRASRLAGAAALVTALLVQARPAMADAGVLDSRFGTHGRVVTHFPRPGAAEAVALDGSRIVVAGTIAGTSGISSVALARYLASGALDRSFGDAGKVVTHVGGKNSINFVGDVAVTRGRRVLLMVFSSLRTSHSLLLRYLPDGTLDPGFGTGGKLRLDPMVFGGLLALLPDGRILVVGGDSADISVARLMPDGELDQSFGSGGVVTTDVGGLQNFVDDVEVQPNGRIVVTGFSYFHCKPACKDMLTLIRYLPDGDLDGHFGTGGSVQVTAGDQFPDGAGLQSNGEIVVATSRSFGTFGCGTTDAALFRFHPNGDLDTSFGRRGQVHVSSTDPHDLVVEPDDHIVIAGFQCPDRRILLSVSGFTEDGEVDGAFGPHGTGTTTVPVGPSNASANVAALQRDGKVVAAGGTYRDLFTRNFALVRFLKA